MQTFRLSKWSYKSLNKDYACSIFFSVLLEMEGMESWKIWVQEEKTSMGFQKEYMLSGLFSRGRKDMFVFLP